MFSIISVTAAPMAALSATYPYDTKLDLKNKTHQFSNGYYVAYSPLFDGTKDVSINKDTIFYISSAMSMTSFLKDISNELGIFDLVIYTAIQAGNGLYLTETGTDLYANGTTVGNDEFFRIMVNNDNTISIYDKNSKLATVDRYGPWNITFQDKFVVDTYNQQKFNLNYKNNGFSISTLFTSPYQLGPSVIERFWSYSPINAQVRTIGVISDDDWSFENKYMFNIPSDYTSYVVSLTTGFINNKIKWVNYDPFNLNVDLNNVIIDDIKQNYLIDNPYNTIECDSKVNAINVNISNLKNIQTPEYEYTTYPVLTSGSSSDNIKRREYEKIFLGTNQQTGYENPFLGFNAYTKEIILKKDKTTYFHYPKTTISAPLSTAGFIECGAHAGSSPARSDKIWKKMANYSRDIYWGNSQQWQRGTWLCSWLSGSDNINHHIKPIWKDRWYFPGCITIIDAITSYATECNPTTSSVIWDEDSSMTMDPGVWYKYYHMGQTGNTDIVATLTGDGTYLKLWLNNWQENQQDLSPYNHNVNIENFKGSVECLVPYSSAFLNDNITVTTWINHNNWDNVKGNHIVSNNFRGGWYISYNNGIITPITTIIDSVCGHVIPLNNEQLFITDKHIVGAKPNKVVVDNKLYSWVMDNSNKKIHKIDFNGDVLKQISYTGSDNLQDMLLDKDNNLYVLINSQLCAYNTNTEALNVIDTSSYTLVNNANRIDINTNNSISSYDCLDVCIDNDNDSWIISSTNVFKNSALMINDFNATNINCDRYNDIWVLGNINEYRKYNSTGDFILSGIVTTNTDISSRSINFINMYNKTQSIDCVIILQDSEHMLYSYDMNGSYINSTDISKSIDISQYLNHDKTQMSFILNGDATGYNWNRKFNYIKNNKQDVLQAGITIGSDISTTNITLTYPVCNLLNNENYYLSMSYDSLSGIANLYINTTMVDNITTNGDPIYHEYENSVIIGANIGKSLSLDKELLTNQYHFDGNAYDVRIYDITLNNSDITKIGLTRSEFVDIKWNMLIGNQNFIEEIERFFKHKLTGMKSQFYNIRLIGLGITDSETRNVIESTIKDTVSNITPAHTHLYKIIWE